MKPPDVPAGPLLLDTNIVSFIYLQKPNSRWTDWAALIQGHLLYVSFATVAEMLALAHKATWGPRRRADLVTHLQRYPVLRFDMDVCKLWAPMHAKLGGHLKGEGVNDLWTAACALAESPSMPIVTDDLSDFQTISASFPLSLVHLDL